MTGWDSVVRVVQPRTLDDRSAPWRNWRLPAPLVYAAWGIGFLRRWSWEVAAGAVIVFWWIATGSFAWGLMLGAVSLAIGLTAWVRWRGRGAEGAAISVKDSVRAARRRRQLDRKWPLACESERVLGTRKRQPPALRAVKLRGPETFEAVIDHGRIGVSLSRIRKAAPDMAGIIGCRDLRVEEIAPGRARLEFSFGSLLIRTVRPSDMPPVVPDLVALGLTPAGGPALIRPDTPLLIVGETGSGKSSTLWGYLAGLIAQGIPVRLRVLDPAGGTEFSALGEQLDRGAADGMFRVVAYAGRPSEAQALIEDAAKAMNARLYDMSRRGVRRHVPVIGEPQDVLLIDELLRLQSVLNKGATSAFADLLSVGRKARFQVTGCSQLGQKVTLGDTRDLFAQRVCHAVRNREMVDVALGTGAHLEAPCYKISKQTPGVGYLYDDAQGAYTQFRSVYISNADTERIARGMLPEGMTAGKAAAPERTALYMWFRGDDDPMTARPGYIGISYDVLRREAEHDTDLREFMSGDVRRITTWYASRQEALDAERDAIKRRRPVHNVQHAGDAS